MIETKIYAKRPIYRTLGTNGLNHYIWKLDIGVHVENQVKNRFFSYAEKRDGRKLLINRVGNREMVKRETEQHGIKSSIGLHCMNQNFGLEQRSLENSYFLHFYIKKLFIIIAEDCMFEWYWI